MKRITIGSQVLITDGRVADLVLAYANLILQSHTTDTVSIPVVGESGQVKSAQLLMGPATQIVVTEDGEGGPDLTIGPTLDDLEHRISRYRAPVSDESIDADPQTYFVKFDDYDR